MRAIMTALERHPGWPFCWIKREGDQPTGSMKIRSAIAMLEAARLPEGATFVESTSGNMGAALAWYAWNHGLHAVLVTDPKISEWHIQQIARCCADRFPVTTVDETGGWLLTRLQKVQDLLKKNPTWYNPNQYTNLWNPLAFEEVGVEIWQQLRPTFRKRGIRTLWYFASVSTGGSLSGSASALRRLVAHAKDMHVGELKVVAVDVEGSVIFGRPPRKRYLNGIGSSLHHPPNLWRNLIDEVAIITDDVAIKQCLALREQWGERWWMGGSTGAILQAVQQYGLRGRFDSHDAVVVLSPDHGCIYEQTLYNPAWRQAAGLLKELPNALV